MNAFNTWSIQGNSPVKLPVKVTQDATGVLTPSFGGQGLAYVTINNGDLTTPKTAVINFHGENQAVVSFDSLGTKGIGYMVLNPYSTGITAMSIENIIAHMNENMLG